MLYHIVTLLELSLFLSAAGLHIVLCPFNKVEESFNTQAVHDVINIFPNNLPSRFKLKANPGFEEVGSRTKLEWDHVQFPGVVPRTSVGAFIIGLPMKLAYYFMSKDYLDWNPNNKGEPDLTSQFTLQIGSRFALASFVVYSLTEITRAIHRKYGLSLRVCFSLLTVSQFHYIFYASRLIPNTFAAILANLVFASWINRQYSKSIIYIAFCVVIFRFDTSLLFGWLLFDGIFIRKIIPFSKVMKIGAPAGLVALLITFAIDSMFWARPLWPELEGLHFNLWLNKSHAWGVKPFFWYIYDILPNLLIFSTPLIMLADHKITRDYMLVTMAFILTYSLLPHKELRFILLVNPLLNISAASGLMNIDFYINKFFASDKKRPRRSFVASLIFLIIISIILLGNITVSFMRSVASSYNYPGGQAALFLGSNHEFLDKAQKTINDNSELVDPRTDVGVYVDNLAAQTGVSRFVQVDGAYYAKSPELDEETFRNSYNLIYNVLEPKEVVEFLKKFCFIEQNQEKFVDKWRGDKSEIKCIIPNQAQMFCSLSDSIRSFKSVDIASISKKINTLNIFEIASFLIERSYIKTKVALHIMRCSTRSKFNPFSQ